MPLINGCKYSCEPCIRGHRATSCAHTDRILIEVRKPGRPLESCGHEFSTCQCGKVAALFSVKGFLDGPMLNSTSLSGLVMNQEPTLFVEAQPTQQPSQQPTQPAPAPKQTAASKARAAKAKSQVKGSRVNKKPRTKSQSSSTPSSKMTASPEPSASSTPPLPSSMEHANQEASSNFETAVVPPLNSSSISQTPQYSSEASRWSPVYREAYQPPTHQFPAFSSRIEDVGGASEGGSFQVQGQTVRSQYIMATEDTVWRAE